MRLYKRFFLCFIITVLLFITYHVLIWFTSTSKIFPATTYYVGDLGRISYQVNSLSPRFEETTLSHRHVTLSDWNGEKIDLITLGDSFSNAMASGTNPYYQDFLATHLNIEVLNVQNLNETMSYIDTIRYLHQHQWLKTLHPKAILIQCVARDALRLLPRSERKIRFSDNELNTTLNTSKFTKEFPRPSWINTANYKVPYYFLAYRYNPHAKKEVYKLPLSVPLFSSHDRDHLLVYHDDLNRIPDITPTAVRHLNHELNLLSDELKKDNITLIFMPSVDKYDLYYPYLLDKKSLPSNPLFDLLGKEPKNYVFIDTKRILSPLLEHHTQDLYFSDDTHWSSKASEEIVKNQNFTFLSKVTRP